jgi:hypothetical protein
MSDLPSSGQSANDGSKTIPHDWKELIDSLITNGVEFLVVGAHALAFHGLPRLTQDLDLWTKTSFENAVRIREALKVFGIDIGEEGVRRFSRQDQMLMIGEPPHRVEFITFVKGCDFDSAWAHRAEGDLAGTKAPFLSLQDYVATKRAAGRPKDLADLDRLREIFGPEIDQI